MNSAEQQSPKEPKASRGTARPVGGTADLAPELLARLAPAPHGPLSRTRALYLGLYGAITDGRLPGGAILPPSRALAARLGLGRNTVTAVYEQLALEGLAVADGRRGTRVAARPGPPERPARPAPVRPSARATGLDPARRGGRGTGRDFAPGEPDATLFPARAWRRALGRASRLPPAELGYRDGPLPALRESVARWLAARRSLVVDPERIVVTSGTRQSLALAAMLFADPGERVWVESPGYAGAADAFAALGLEVVARGVDGAGLVPASRGEAAPAMIYVTPCFQYPTGVALSAERRAALLAFSARRGTVLVEDDYDSEFRGDDEPRPALGAEADAAGAAVLTAGTCSKLAFPAARVAWLVVPPGCAERAEACLRTLGGGHAPIHQAAIASLMDDGTLARHVQRSRAVYRRRREVLVEALGATRRLALAPGSAGSLSAVVALERAVPIDALEGALAAGGFGARPLERFVVGAPEPTRCHRLVLGLGDVDALALPDRLAALDALVAELPGRRPAPPAGGRTARARGPGARVSGRPART